MNGLKYTLFVLFFLLTSLVYQSPGYAEPPKITHGLYALNMSVDQCKQSAMRAILALNLTPRITVDDQVFAAYGNTKLVVSCGIFSDIVVVIGASPGYSVGQTKENVDHIVRQMGLQSLRSRR